MVDGVEEIVTVVARYRDIERPYQSQLKKMLKQESEKHSVILYKHIIHSNLRDSLLLNEKPWVSFHTMCFWCGTATGFSPDPTVLLQDRRCLRSAGDHLTRRCRM